MKFEDLTPELQTKLNACEDLDQVLELVKSEGVELADEDLEQISGGWGDDDEPKVNYNKCPKCGSTDVGIVSYGTEESNHTVCTSCGYVWWWHGDEAAKKYGGR